MKKRFRSFIAAMLALIIFSSLLSVSLINTNALSNTEIQSKLVDILYGDGGGYVSCDFDGYTTTSGRHEGIDFIRYKDAPVHSLINGTVIRVYNSSSSSTLSTLAIYDEQNNKSVIYLHTANICVSVGDSVSQGQLVAYESDRGISGVPHTHVEVRDGRQGYASKSVNDPVLDNPNPYPYWEIVVQKEPDNPIVNGLYYHGADDYSNFRPVIRFSNPETVAGVNFALKYEGSDWHWYEGTYNGADAWYCDVLSSDLGSGEEIVCHCYVSGKNGSYVGYAFSQDPKVEELLYHGSTNNSDFRPVAKISNPDSVSEVKFAVKYEGGDWHWFDGNFNGANAWYCDVLSSDLGTGTTIVCHCYIYGKNGHTKGYALPELSLEKDSYPVVESWYFDGATDHSDFRPVIRLQNPETVSYVKFAVKYDASDWHWYDGQFNGGNAWFCDVLSDDLGSGKTIICHGYVYANNGSYMGYPFSDLKLDKDYDNPIIEEWKYNIDHKNNSIHYQIKCENPETVSKIQFAIRTDNTEWIWHEGNYNDDKIWSIDIPLDDFNENDNVVCHCYVKGRNGSNNGYPFSEIKINEISCFAVGDTNLDGIVSISDVTAIQRHLAELEVFNDEQLALADTNGDGDVDIADATHLQMYLAEYDVVLGKQTT